jgi:hypothetical protein
MTRLCRFLSCYTCPHILEIRIDSVRELLGSRRAGPFSLLPRWSLVVRDKSTKFCHLELLVSPLHEYTFRAWLMMAPKKRKDLTRRDSLYSLKDILNVRFIRLTHSDDFLIVFFIVPSVFRNTLLVERLHCRLYGTALYLYRSTV